MQRPTARLPSAWAPRRPASRRSRSVILSFPAASAPSPSVTSIPARPGSARSDRQWRGRDLSDVAIGLGANALIGFHHVAIGEGATIDPLAINDGTAHWCVQLRDNWLDPMAGTCHRLAPDRFDRQRLAVDWPGSVAIGDGASDGGFANSVALGAGTTQPPQPGACRWPHDRQESPTASRSTMRSTSVSSIRP